MRRSMTAMASSGTRNLCATFSHVVSAAPTRIPSPGASHCVASRCGATSSACLQSLPALTPVVGSVSTRGLQCASSATSSGGSVGCGRTSFLPSRRVCALRSAASVAGRASGLNISRGVRVGSGCEAGCVGVRSDGGLAGKETLLEQAELQSEAEQEKGLESPQKVRGYPFPEVEARWQQHWEENQTFRTPDAVDSTKPKYYVLDMFPYPSGAGLHVGHPEGYTATDIMARYKRMRGFNVLQSMDFEKIGPVAASRGAISEGALTHGTSAKVKFLGVFIGFVDNSKRKRQDEKALEKRRRVIHRLRQLQKQRKESWEKEVERTALNAFTRGYRKTLNTLRSGSKAKQAIFDKATELGMKAALTLTPEHPIMTSDNLKKLLEQEEDHFGRLGWDYLPVSVKTAYENLMLSIDDACEKLKAESEFYRCQQARPIEKQHMEIRSPSAEQSDFDLSVADEPEVSDSEVNLCYGNVMDRVADAESLCAAYERIKSKLQLLSGRSDEDWNDLSTSSFDRVVHKLRFGTYQFSPVSQIHVRKPGKEGAVRAIVVVNPRDQIVGEAIRAVLERIYEPVFMVGACRYKLARSCHMALKMVKNSWKGTTWFIHYKSPIAFGKVQHENLLRILSAKVKDEEFLYLLQQMFKVGVISLGDPGSRLSALLCNIYYHQLDMEVSRLQVELNTGSNKRIEKQAAEVSSYARVRYVRYGEEFLFGITGTKAMAMDVLNRVQTFLRRDLKLHGP